MSAKQINISKTETADWELEVEASSTKIPASLSYQDSFTGWQSRVPDFGSAHPDLPHLSLVKYKGSRLEGNLIKVALSYESSSSTIEYPGRKPGAIKRYSLEPSHNEEGLLTFYKLKDDLIDEWKEVVSELLASSRTKADFEKATAAVGTDALALFAIDKVRNGRESYLNGGLMWVERSQTEDLGDMELAKHLKIDDPPGNPPALADGANWLYMAGPATPNEDGKSWEIEKRWWASGRGGWDEWFYAPDPPPGP